MLSPGMAFIWKFARFNLLIENENFKIDSIRSILDRRHCCWSPPSGSLPLQIVHFLSNLRILSPLRLVAFAIKFVIKSVPFHRCWIVCPIESNRNRNSATIQRCPEVAKLRRPLIYFRQWNNSRGLGKSTRNIPDRLRCPTRCKIKILLKVNQWFDSSSINSFNYQTNFNSDD